MTDEGFLRVVLPQLLFPDPQGYKTTAQRVSGGAKCTTGHVTEEQVYGAFESIVQKLIAQRPEVIAACEQILEELLSTDDLAAREDRLKTEAGRITEKVERLMTKASRETVEGFAEAYGKLEAEMNRVTGKLDAVEQERKEREFKGRQIKLFISTLGQMEAEMAETVEPAEPETAERAETAETEEELFLALVDKVIVGEKMKFVLKDGSEW